jgi:hypothetical protein
MKGHWRSRRVIYFHQHAVIVEFMTLDRSTEPLRTIGGEPTAKAGPCRYEMIE